MSVSPDMASPLDVCSHYKSRLPETMLMSVGVGVGELAPSLTGPSSVDGFWCGCKLRLILPVGH